MKHFLETHNSGIFGYIKKKTKKPTPSVSNNLVYLSSTLQSLDSSLKARWHKYGGRVELSTKKPLRKFLLWLLCKLFQGDKNRRVSDSEHGGPERVETAWMTAGLWEEPVFSTPDGEEFDLGLCRSTSHRVPGNTPGPRFLPVAVWAVCRNINKKENRRSRNDTIGKIDVKLCTETNI